MISSSISLWLKSTMNYFSFLNFAEAFFIGQHTLWQNVPHTHFKRMNYGTVGCNVLCLFLFVFLLTKSNLLVALFRSSTFLTSSACWSVIEGCIKIMTVDISSSSSGKFYFICLFNLFYLVYTNLRPWSLLVGLTLYITEFSI